MTQVYIFIALAILFQPVFKIILGRMVGNVVDFFVAIGLLISVFSTNNKNH